MSCEKDYNRCSVPDASRAVTLLLNAIESLWQKNDGLNKENQELKDEINRLKGEHGSPPEKPAKNPKTEGEAKTDAEAASGTKKKKSKNHKTGGKKAKTKIDRTVECEIDKI